MKYSDLDKRDIKDLYIIYCNIIYYIEDINNFVNTLAENEVVEYKGSVFDEFDAENDAKLNIKVEEENRYSYYLDSLNYLFKYAITSCRNSLIECLNMNIIDLVEYIKFDIKYNEEHKDDNKNEKD